MAVGSPTRAPRAASRLPQRFWLARGVTRRPAEAALVNYGRYDSPSEDSSEIVPGGRSRFAAPIRLRRTVVYVIQNTSVLSTRVENRPPSRLACRTTGWAADRLDHGGSGCRT